MSEAAISDTDTSDTDTARPIKLSDQYPPKFSSVEEERIDRKTA